MVDTLRTDAELIVIFQDGQAPGSITPQDMRDLIVSKLNSTMPSVIPSRVEDFRNSMGVATHVVQGDAQSNASTVVANIKYVGARFIRDGNSVTASQLAVFKAIMGSGINYITGIGLSSTLNVANELAAVKACVQLTTGGPGYGGVIAVELCNEPNNFPVTYNGVTSTMTASPGFLPVAQFCSDFYIALKGDAVTRSIPVFGATSGGAEANDVGLQFLTIPYGYAHATLTTNATTANANATLHFASTVTSPVLMNGLFIYGTGIAAGATISSFTATTVVMSLGSSGGVASGSSIRFGAMMADGTVYADVQNLHEYPMYPGGGQQGQIIQPSPGFDSVDAELGSQYSTTWNASYAGLTMPESRALPKVVTEFGYDTAPAAIGAGLAGITQTISGRNRLTGWLALWNRGYAYNCQFSLFDTVSDSGDFGLLTTAGAPKLAGTYLHNFTTIVNDTGFMRGTFAPVALRLSLSGMPVTAESALMQRVDGTYFLILWNNVTNWNFATGVAVAVGGTSVTVTFERSGTINTYDPTIGISAQQTLTSNVVSVSLADIPLIISFI